MIFSRVVNGELWLRLLSGPDIDALGLSNAEIVVVIAYAGPAFTQGRTLELRRAPPRPFRRGREVRNGRVATTRTNADFRAGGSAQSWSLAVLGFCGAGQGRCPACGWAARLRLAAFWLLKHKSVICYPSEIGGGTCRCARFSVTGSGMIR